MSAQLNGRSALVTGSTHGIGVAMAQALAGAGAHVVVSGRDASAGLAVVKAINEAGGTSDFVAADLARGAIAVRALADAATDVAGQIDILVNNAAMLIKPSPTEQVTEALVDEALAVNVKAVILLTGLLAPPMAERGSGSIVNIGSIAGLFGMEGTAVYGATKATIHALTRAWAAEYGPRGVRVNTVAPGPTMTEKTAMMQDRLGPLVAGLPSGRMSRPDEVASAVLFLAGDDASNIHGAILSVDGGRAAV